MQLLEDATTQISPVRALHSVLRAHGLDAADFDFEEHESGFAELLDGGGRILAVRCRSTGEERLYATGTDSAWLGAFIMDLGSGHFGMLPRVAG